MVDSWGFPPKVEEILYDLNNLNMSAIIYKDTLLDLNNTDEIFYWSNFKDSLIIYKDFFELEDNFYIYSDNSDFENYNINLNADIYFGTLDVYNKNNELTSFPTAVIDKNI